MTPDTWIVLAVAAVIVATAVAMYRVGWCAGVEHERQAQADRDRMIRSARFDVHELREGRR